MTREKEAMKKETWAEGEWQHEPDRKEWKDEKTGLDCMIIRNQMGALCGYVGVPEGHPAHGKGYNDVDIDVHGGLTYAAECHGHICHKTEGGDHVWWFGFDCAHSRDLVPSFTSTIYKEIIGRESIMIQDSTYRNMAYVENEVSGLAQQLKDVK